MGGGGKIRARAARACCRLAEAGGSSYGRVAGMTRGASQHLRAPFGSAAANLRLLAKLPGRLSCPSVATVKKRVSLSVEREERVGPSSSVEPPCSGSSRVPAEPRLVCRGRTALQEGLQAAARTIRKPPRAALGMVRAVGRRHKWPPPPPPPPPTTRPPAVSSPFPPYTYFHSEMD